MKPLASRLSTQLALALAALAALPAAQAGSEIMKCVDSAGHVTLTDQPCASGTRATRLVVVAAPEAAAAEPAAPAAPQQGAVQRYEAPPAMLRQQDWRPRVASRDRPLARDVATLKAARAQLMLLDADRHPRPQLATIQ